MSPHLISIIIPLYNAERYIAQAIESVLSQSYKSWELIIVDDGSTDNSLTVAKKFESPTIKVFSIPNSGAAAARNYGYYKSSGDYIKFFDADDLISENMLEEQIKLTNSLANCIISSKWGRFYNDDLKTFREVPEDCWQDFDSITWLQKSWRRGTSMTQPGMFLIRRDVLENVGLWNPQLSLIDDFEFFTRIILASREVKFCKKAILYYRSGMGTNSLSGKKSPKHIQSAYTSIKLATEKLLAIDNTDLTKTCCANAWQSFIYEFYNADKVLTKNAQAAVKKLGGSDLPFSSGGITKILVSIIGWKLTKKIKLLVK